MPTPITLTDSDLGEFAKANGAMEVHRSWRDRMLAQGRNVDDDKMTWEGLSVRDQILDEVIAFDVIRDFVIWYNAHVAEE